MNSTAMWHKLNGIFCVFKPKELTLKFTREQVIFHLVNTLNESETYNIEKYVQIDGSVEKKLKVKLKDRLSSHPLALGKAYDKQDIFLSHVNYLSFNVSGVCLIGVNKGIQLAKSLKEANLMSTFRVKGVLGKATDTRFTTGKVLERATFDHVTSWRMECVLMTIQANHQRRAMTHIGPDLGSPVLYEILKEDGLVRTPAESEPLAYVAKCIHFEPPNFTIEVSSLNATKYFLTQMVHQTGLMLKTTAAVESVRCLRVGPFDVNAALSQRQWHAPDILQSIEQVTPKCEELLEQFNERKTAVIME